ncbi:NAD(P)-dependent alcohol dehydrogenase [Pelagibacterium sp. 26DY04]|uniref:NAD(P)-dependent alcohol dehydrogenase n=1 Tax=Pelagibacterium sp. 26DY04 TaxID=2967130 RepID=UPI0028152C15|nr:NAD(P)-dependent alcohol dehydrogenase [Pelagibacterium sp. 26DY04]WMT85233.1 NAD(P)-dependent alcohol dehydrogenase [Pelagibacterium sp. 26DY04]
MRAVVSKRYGPPHTLRLCDVPVPKPGPGEVLVRVCAASVNSWDWDRLIGKPLARIAEPFGPSHKIAGADIAGVIEALGEGSEGFAVGDPVFGDLSDGNWGGFAEYACAPISALAHIPDGLSFIDAATLPQAGALALQSLRKSSVPKPSILINGAGGGVGTFAIQMAKQLGAAITAVDSPGKRDRVLALGANAFIDYRTIDFTTAGDQYDLIIDVVAHRSAGAYARALREGGVLVVIGGTIRSLLSVACFGSVIGKTQRKRLGVLFYEVSPPDFSQLAGQCVDGRLIPIIDSVFPLERAAEALQRIGGGEAIGKIIISVSD